MNAMQATTPSYGAHETSDRPIDLGRSVTSLAEIDTDAILSAIGELVYTWEIEEDRLYFSGNASAILKVADHADVTSGTAFQQLIDTEGGPDTLRGRHGRAARRGRGH